MATEHINIPKAMLSKYKWDKSSCELLALSVCIKCHFYDSLVKNVSVRKIQSIAHCGYGKAKKLLQMAKDNSEWFYYNPYTNSLLAKNFKKRYKVVSTDKHGRTCYSMYTIQVERKDYSIRELVSEFRCKLMLNAVKAVQIREDKSISKKKTMPYLSQTTPLTNKILANTIGVKNTKQVCRTKKKMVNRGTISYQKPTLIYATNCLSDEAIKHRNLSNTYLIISHDKGTGYIVTRATYKIEDRREYESCKNIIFNHARRLTNNPSKKVKLNDVDAYYERMEH